MAEQDDTLSQFSEHSSGTDRTIRLMKECAGVFMHNDVPSLVLNIVDMPEDPALFLVDPEHLYLRFTWDRWYAVKTGDLLESAAIFRRKNISLIQQTSGRYQSRTLPVFRIASLPEELFHQKIEDVTTTISLDPDAVESRPTYTFNFAPVRINPPPAPAVPESPPQNELIRKAAEGIDEYRLLSGIQFSELPGTFEGVIRETKAVIVRILSSEKIQDPDAELAAFRDAAERLKKERKIEKVFMAYAAETAEAIPEEFALFCRKKRVACLDAAGLKQYLETHLS